MGRPKSSAATRRRKGAATRHQRPVGDAERVSPPWEQGRTSRPWFLRWPALLLLLAVAVVFSRIVSAGFVLFDDDFQVYANPFLNPPTFQSVGRLWAHAYQQLYVPLAYSILAAIAGVARTPAHLDTSLGAAVSLDPMAFHLVSVALHALNAWLCFSLVRHLTGRTRAAWICALVFALHPLQVESVAWISELRGVTSATFALLALNTFVLSRRGMDQVASRGLLALSALLVGCAMLCKPSAAALPLVAVAIDRVVFRTAWRRTVVAAAIWSAAVVPLICITRSTQSIPAAAQSLSWQRPFIAGDALAFYLFKTVVPINLCVDYGRTPSWLMSRGWGYLTWIVPAGLLLGAYLGRRRRPLTWLGGLLVVAFLLPTLGLVPFAYQAYSTVADRYAYLALIGVGLVIADASEAAERPTLAARGVAIAVVALAVLSFTQSRHWLTSPEFLRHTIEVNPAAGFAYNNLGDTELANRDLSAALADYKSSITRDPTRAKAYINLAEVYVGLGQPAQAEEAVGHAVKMPEMTADDLTNLGIVLMKMNQPDRALEVLSRAVQIDPDSPTYLFNQANALSAAGQFQKAEAVFRRCVQVAPSLAGAHTGLGIVLAETHRLAEAVSEFRMAVSLQPNDPAALDDLKRAEAMIQGQGD